MRERSSAKLVIALLLLAGVVIGVKLGGGYLWALLLRMHGQRSHARSAAAAPGEPLRGDAAWPRTSAGELARGWVEAFSSGEEAMREFLGRSLAADSLAERSIDERLASYRTLHQRLGTLALDSILRSTENELEAAMIAADGESRELTFRVGSDAPVRLLSVTLKERHAH